jgi:ribosomal protein L29
MSKKMSMVEIREKAPAELKKVLVALYEERFKMRMKMSVSGEVKTHRFSQIRKSIAQIKTRLAEEAVK